MSTRDAELFRGHRKRLKERFIDSGIDSLLDHEVIELLLSYSLPRRDVKPLAKLLLKKFGSLKGLLDADMNDVLETNGVGRHSAILIRLVKAIGPLYLREIIDEKEQITSTDDVLDYCRSSMSGLKEEHLNVIFLNSQNRVLAIEDIHKGTVNQAVVYPRQIIESSLRYRASAIILVHNHPSGCPRPSKADISLTGTVKEAARTLDITVHDHIIIAGSDHFSFLTEGLL